MTGAPAEVGDRLADLALARVDGTPVMLSELVRGPTIVPIVRYYGCMPCRDFLLALDELRDQAHDAGVGIVGVGRAADYQARHLMESSVAYELVLDPDQLLYRALDLRRFGWWKMFDPRTWRNYLRALRRARQGRITNHPLQSPGVVVLDTDLRIVYLHRGATIGDYPPATEVLGHAVPALEGREASPPRSGQPWSTANGGSGE